MKNTNISLTSENNDYTKSIDHCHLRCYTRSILNLMVYKRQKIDMLFKIMTSKTLIAF